MKLQPSHFVRALQWFPAANGRIYIKDHDDVPSSNFYTKKFVYLFCKFFLFDIITRGYNFFAEQRNVIVTCRKGLRDSYVEEWTTFFLQGGKVRVLSRKKEIFLLPPSYTGEDTGCGAFYGAGWMAGGGEGGVRKRGKIRLHNVSWSVIVYEWFIEARGLVLRQHRPIREESVHTHRRWRPSARARRGHDGGKGRKGWIDSGYRNRYPVPPHSVRIHPIDPDPLETLALSPLREIDSFLSRSISQDSNNNIFPPENVTEKDANSDCSWENSKLYYILQIY